MPFSIRNKLFLLLLGLALVVGGFLLGRSTFPQQTMPQNLPSLIPTLSTSPTIKETQNETFRVTRVVDGDTIEVSAGSTRVKVRYIGIDTPETVDPRKPVQCFGKEAAAENRKLVENKAIRMEKDISETDKYGRLLRYVFVDNLFVNDYLARQGFAHASTYPPDVKYQEQFRQAEKEARENQRGLWAKGACEITLAPVSNQTDCPIKGNISSSGEKIYHLPGQRYYDKTTIDKSKGERWFCSEEEAISSGWRKAKI